MLTAFVSALKTPDLRKKILFSLGMIAVYRLGAAIPSPGVSYSVVDQCISEQAGGTTDVYTLLNLFSGGALLRLSVFALGIMPYITASIIVQLLTVVIPRFEQLKKQGQSGQAKMTQYTRYLTIGLGLLQSAAFIALALNGTMFAGCSVGDQLIPDRSPMALLVLVLTMTAGTAVIMWMGELITDRGIGNGMSLLIFTSIAARIPNEGSTILNNSNGVIFAVFIMIALAVIAAVVFVEQGQRRLPVQYAKRMIGRKQYGGTTTYLPLKVNQAGVIPVIFATSLLYIPTLLIQLIGNPSVDAEGNFTGGWQLWVQQNIIAQGTWSHIALYFGLIIFFTYFYVGHQLQSDRARRRPQEIRRLHPRNPARPAHRGIPAVRAQQDHPARLALSGHRRDPAQPLPRRHRRRKQPELPLRRHCGADHGRRRSRHGEADRNPTDATQL